MTLIDPVRIVELAARVASLEADRRTAVRLSIDAMSATVAPDAPHDAEATAAVARARVAEIGGALEQAREQLAELVPSSGSLKQQVNRARAVHEQTGTPASEAALVRAQIALATFRRDQAAGWLLGAAMFKGAPVPSLLARRVNETTTAARRSVTARERELRRLRRRLARLAQPLDDLRDDEEHHHG